MLAAERFQDVLHGQSRLYWANIHSISMQGTVSCLQLQLYLPQNSPESLILAAGRFQDGLYGQSRLYWANIHSISMQGTKSCQLYLHQLPVYIASFYTVTHLNNFLMIGTHSPSSATLHSHTHNNTFVNSWLNSLLQRDVLLIIRFKGKFKSDKQLVSVNILQQAGSYRISNIVVALHVTSRISALIDSKQAQFSFYGLH